MEKRRRSALKSLIWRICGILILGIITYAYTKHWVQTSLITFLHHGIFFFVYIIHERLYLKFCKTKNLTKRSIYKCLTYETLLGNLILGTITYLVTGNWKTVSAITITYVSIKHIVYIFNEFVWKKFER